MIIKKIGCVIIFYLLFAFVGREVAYSQVGNQRDSLVRLIDARSAKLEDRGGAPYRIVQGPARFLHNNTYLLCDSAVWNVNSDVIDAIGHVQIIQQDTYLVGDKLTYFSQQNLAQFRGEIVRLYNKKGDQLKTKFLDYNTHDSVAYFYNGGAMRSKDGDIIEGRNGRYESETRFFSFDGDVAMYSDSIFISSSMAEYHSNTETAYFYENTIAWRGRDTLFSNNANFQQKLNLLTLTRDNYIATQDQEVWAGRINYYRNSGDAQLFDNVQIKDQEQKMILLGDHGIYYREPTKAIMTQKPVALMYSEEQVKETIKDSTGVSRDSIYIRRDTLFTAGDTLKMWQLPKYQIDSSEVVRAEQRRKLIDLDPLDEINQENEKFFEAYYRNKAQLGKPKDPGIAARRQQLESNNSDTLIRNSDTINFKRDSLIENNKNIKLSRDTLNDKSDTLSVVASPRDTIKITFMAMYNNVRMFRNDVSGRCDSLIYTSLDSIARFYKDPVLWNDQSNQFTSDSIQVALRNNALYKANLIENAMIITQEDSIHFNQVKSVEMIAYFNQNDIYRFDALGGVQAMLFFREREDAVTLMNQKECKLLSARILNREIQRVRYIHDVKSDMIPTYRLPIEKQRLRGFNWRIEDMPKDRWELTDRKIRDSKRGSLADYRFPAYSNTQIYFPESYKTIMKIKTDVDERIDRENREKIERENQERIDRENQEREDKERVEDENREIIIEAEN